MQTKHQIWAFCEKRALAERRLFQTKCTSHEQEDCYWSHISHDPRDWESESNFPFIKQFEYERPNEWQSTNFFTSKGSPGLWCWAFYIENVESLYFGISVGGREVRRWYFEISKDAPKRWERKQYSEIVKDIMKNDSNFWFHKQKKKIT